MVDFMDFVYLLVFWAKLLAFWTNLPTYCIVTSAGKFTQNAGNFFPSSPRCICLTEIMVHAVVDM